MEQDDKIREMPTVRKRLQTRAPYSQPYHNDFDSHYPGSSGIELCDFGHPKMPASTSSQASKSSDGTFSRLNKSAEPAAFDVDAEGGEPDEDDEPFNEDDHIVGVPKKAFWIGVATVILFIIGCAGLVIYTILEEAREEARVIANYKPIAYLNQAVFPGTSIATCEFYNWRVGFGVHVVFQDVSSNIHLTDCTTGCIHVDVLDIQDAKPATPLAIANGWNSTDYWFHVFYANKSSFLRERIWAGSGRRWEDGSINDLNIQIDEGSKLSAVSWQYTANEQVFADAPTGAREMSRMTLLFYQSNFTIQELMGAGTATDYIWKLGEVFYDIKENASISTTRVEDNNKQQVVHLFFETHENGLAHREKSDSGWTKDQFEEQGDMLTDANQGPSLVNASSFAATTWMAGYGTDSQYQTELISRFLILDSNGFIVEYQHSNITGWIFGRVIQDDLLSVGTTVTVARTFPQGRDTISMYFQNSSEEVNELYQAVGTQTWLAQNGPLPHEFIDPGPMRKRW